MSIILPEPQKGEILKCVTAEAFYPAGVTLTMVCFGSSAAYGCEIEGACSFCGINKKILSEMPYQHPVMWHRLLSSGFSGETVIAQPVKPVFDKDLDFPYYQWVDDTDPIQVMLLQDLKKLFCFSLEHHISTVKRLDKSDAIENETFCKAMLNSLFCCDVSLGNDAKVLFSQVEADLRMGTTSIIHSHKSDLNKKNLSKRKCVYAIGDQDRGVFKIGVSENADSRVLGIQTGYPYPLEILYVSPKKKNFVALESKLHHVLSDFRLNGEWFDITAYQLIDWSSI